MRRLGAQALFFFAVLGSAEVARADATADVRDIRAGKLPRRYEWLGYDGETAHLRTLVCSEGGTVSCRAAFVKQTERGATSTEVLSVAEVYCGGQDKCEAMDKDTVARFVAADARARQALPASIVKSPPAADATTVFGSVLGEPTKVDLVARAGTRDGSPDVTVALVLRGKDGVTEVLGTAVRHVFRVNASAIRGAFVSPSGEHATFVVTADVGVMCWDFQELEVVSVGVRHHKASLANSIGFQAYKKKDMALALRGFIEATRIDPSFGLAWYNRAALESLAGDAAAVDAFDRALAIDRAFATRACKDDDFASLRSAHPDRFDCAKPKR